MNAIANDLTEDGFVLRYRTEETDDGLSGKEGTFLICSFWLVSALAIVGEVQRARDLMDRLLRIASPLGLLRRGVRRGNRPSPRQLPAGVLAPRADRGGGANHRSRAAEGALTMDSYDVIIIGTGAGGGTLARHLAPSGKRILLLERGDWLPARAVELVGTRRLRRQPLRLRGHLVRREGHDVPAADPLLRRRGDQALRSRALPPPQGGLRRAQAPGRHLAGLADRVRGARAVLHARRAALRGPRRTRRGPDRAARERAVPLPGALARAADPAALRTTWRRPATTRSTRRTGSG